MLEETDEEAPQALIWKKILLLQRVLSTPLADGVRWTFATRCNFVLNDNWDVFTVGCFKKRTYYEPGSMSKSMQTKKKIQRSRSLLEMGEISRSYRALDADLESKKDHAELISIYRDKLGNYKEGTIVEDVSTDTEELVISSECLREIIKQCGKGVSNSAITSNRYEVFKILLGKSSSMDEIYFLNHFTQLINRLVNGKIPPSIAPLLIGTIGLVIPKGGGSWRPLGLREAFSNLAIKCALRTEKLNLMNVFENINWAMAGPNKMSELIALSTNHLRASHHHDNIFLDISNAFNECNREVAAKEIFKRCPKIARLFNLFYQNDSNAWLKDENNWVHEDVTAGCVQGCCMGPLTFAFATLPLYEKVSQTLHTKENALFGAYSDDSLIAASHDDATLAFRTFTDNLNDFHLRLNYMKTVVLLGKCSSNEEAQERAETYFAMGIPRDNIRIHPDNEGDKEKYGYKHLGVPIGSSEYCESKLVELINEFDESCNRDDIVQSAQQKWVYLLWCIRQKFPFWFKHMCPSLTFAHLPDIVNILKRKFEDVADFKLTDKVWTQVCLPIKAHGCGIGKPEDTIAAAFVAHVEETIGAVKSRIDDPYLEFFDLRFEIPPDYMFPSRSVEVVVKEYRRLKQKIIDVTAKIGDSIDEQRVEEIKSKKKLQHYYFSLLSKYSVVQYEEDIKLHGNTHDKARTLSNNGSFAGAWLHSVPMKNESQMDNLTFRHALKIRLGVAFEDRPGLCKCKTRSPIDPHVDHLFNCHLFTAGIKDRHDAMVHVFGSLCQHAGKPFSIPKHGDLRTPTEDDGKTPDGLIRGLNRKPLYFDVTIANPTSITYLNRRSATEEHVAIKDREKVKNDKYAQRCQQIDTDFMPMAFEIYGACSEKFDSLLKVLVQFASDANHIPYSVLLNYWRKRFSVTLQVFNSRLITQAYLLLLDKGGGNLERDFSSARAFEMYG